MEIKTNESVEKYVAELISVEPNGIQVMPEWEWRKSLIGLSGNLYVFEDSIHTELGGQYAILYDEQGQHLRTSCGTAVYSDDKLVFTTKSSIYTFKIIPSSC